MAMERRTIGVVDDEPSICKALKRLLTSTGFEVITYCSSQEFLDDSSHLELDLLILDVQMPGLTGLDLQKQLKSSGYTTPIIFISANGNAQAKDTAMATGAVGFFQKPVDEKDLLGAIHNSISPKKQTES